MTYVRQLINHLVHATGRLLSRSHHSGGFASLSLRSCSACRHIFHTSSFGGNGVLSSRSSRRRTSSAPLYHPPSNAFLKHQRPKNPHRKAFPIGPSRAKASYARTTGAATPTVFLVPSAVSQESGRIGNGPSMNAKLPAINTSVRPATITDHQATMGDWSKSVFAATQYVIQAISAIMNNQIMRELYDD